MPPPRAAGCPGHPTVLLASTFVRATPRVAAADGSAGLPRARRAGGRVRGRDWARWPEPADAPEDSDAVIGLEARKPLRAGTAVAARDLSAARVIRKEDAVSVRFRAGGVTLALKGTAMTAAARGETVRIMNNQSKTVLEAVAAGPGLAVVGPEAEALKGARFATR